MQAEQSIRNILNASSVAVVGASTNPEKFGHMTLKSLIDGGYQGKIYPVNPKADSILDLPAYPSLSAIPGGVELVLILVSAEHVPAVMREAAAIGAKGAIMLTAGFRESGFPEREAEIASIAREINLPFIGPNIQGVYYLPNKLSAVFFPPLTTPGPLSIVSQSGSITAGIAEWAEDEGLGISAAINVGNQTNLQVADMLEFLATDELTGAIAVYLEGLLDGRHFIETIRRVTRKKPVAVLKSGRTAIGRESVASHTGSLAGRDEIFGAVCRQFGLVRADTMEALYDCAKGLATLKQPAGNRVLVVSTSGGGATLAADSAEKYGLVFPSLPAPLAEELKVMEGLHFNANIANPIDLAGITNSHFDRAMTLADKYDAADIYLLSLGDPVERSAELAIDLKSRMKGQLAVVYFGGGKEQKRACTLIHRAGIPVFPTPERAMQGIGASVWNRQFRQEQLQNDRVE